MVVSVDWLVGAVGHVAAQEARPVATDLIRRAAAIGADDSVAAR